MKLILWHVKFLGFEDKRKSTRPYGIGKVLKAKSRGEFTDALALFSCIEKNDTLKELKDAKNEVCKMMNSIRKTKRIVIVPFVHLSENTAPPEKARMFLEILESELRSAGFDIHSVSFGYHKTFELHFRGLGHPMAVAYRSFPRGQEGRSSLACT